MWCVLCAVVPHARVVVIFMIPVRDAGNNRHFVFRETRPLSGRLSHIVRREIDIIAARVLLIRI